MEIIMDLTTAIETRRSVGKFTSQSVDMLDIEDILQAGCWAPTHYKTQPWRFHIFTGDSRQILADIFAKGVAEQMSADENYEQKLEKAKNAPLRAPLIITITCKLEEERQAPVWEEQAAVSAAIQNMSLQAHALGLGSIWRTGFFTELKSAQEFFDIDETKGEKIMGYLYIGYSNMPESAISREEPDFRLKTKFY
jgi:nitroreductase